MSGGDTSLAIKPTRLCGENEKKPCKKYVTGNNLGVLIASAAPIEIGTVNKLKQHITGPRRPPILSVIQPPHSPPTNEPSSSTDMQDAAIASDSPLLANITGVQLVSDVRSIITGMYPRHRQMNERILSRQVKVSTSPGTTLGCGVVPSPVD